MTLGKGASIGRLLFAHVDGPCAATRMRHKARRWLHDSRRRRRQKDRTFIQCVCDAIQLKRHFSKPADVRSNPAAALAARNLHGRIVSIRIVECRPAAPIATAFEKFTVHVHDALRSSLLMQVVYILSAEE